MDLENAGIPQDSIQSNENGNHILSQIDKSFDLDDNNKILQGLEEDDAKKVNDELNAALNFLDELGDENNISQNENDKGSYYRSQILETSKFSNNSKMNKTQKDFGPNRRLMQILHDNKDLDHLTQEMAEIRSQQISEVTYEISVTLEKGDSYHGSMEISFKRSEYEEMDLIFEFTGTITELYVNDNEIEPDRMV